MSPLKSTPYYWVECDKCGHSAQESSDYTAWSDAGEAMDTAIDTDFTRLGDVWLCDECGPACCPECQEAPPGAKERDYACGDCWPLSEGAEPIPADIAGIISGPPVEDVDVDAWVRRLRPAVAGEEDES